MIGPGNSKKMTKDEVLTVKDAVHKLQLSLLDGIKHENQLTAAGSLISRSDYQDVVTERTISERVWKEISTLNPAKLNEVLKLFDGLSLDSDVNMGKNGDLGLSGLKIQEKTDTVAGQVALEEWIGPSNAIDGYVPRRDRDLKHPQSNNNKGSKHRHVRPNAADILSYDMNFTRNKIQNKSKNVITKDDKLSLLENIAGPSQNDSTKAVKELQESTAGALKSSLKTSVLKKATRSVTWADEKTDDEEVGEESYRFASAEACAMALTQAAEEVASGKSEASDAGMKFLSGPLQLKWPPKPGFSSDDLFDSEDSWYDSPPEGFNLTLSPFSTMFMALFSWVSSSSLAYIYGKEESFHEEYLSVNGREYPQKIVMRMAFLEIKQTLAGCLARALPGLVAELRLPIPVSTLEQGMGRLLDTMSFIDPLPAFRMKQWYAIVLLFLDALSVSRIPALTPYMMDRRILLPKVIEGAQISAEEFEIMKDLIIPLGRVPQFSTQSGG
ncbi:hypothetical protein DH2020_003171 [Rehmannia glutinosa]|uniref:RNA polymerase II subunit B1 CTD phosphatase RPAP2 homolog n=1 Tax=Rehmannia glutinosa TaxID=99300 RepID=A0ABR0XKU4_REHGL